MDEIFLLQIIIGLVGFIGTGIISVLVWLVLKVNRLCILGESNFALIERIEKQQDKHDECLIGVKQRLAKLET